MRTTLAVSAIALLAVTAPAAAADVYASTKDPLSTAYAAPAPTWTGFIVGVGAVGAYVNHDVEFQIDHVTQVEANGLAGFGPGADFLVGFRYQFPQSRLVFGIEAEYDILDTPFTLSFPTNGMSMGVNKEGQWAILGTAGLLINQHTMAYVGGGFGQGFYHISQPFGPVTGLNSNPTVDEIVFKAGLEAKLPWVAQGAFIRGEYEFRGGDTTTLWSATSDKPECSKNCSAAVKDTPDTNVVKVVLGYQFGTGSTPLDSLK